MNKYKTLAFNTIIFIIGSFSSKIISLLLNNLYTKHISPSNLYTKSLIETLALFLVPVFTLSMKEAVIRYGLDDKYDDAEVFTTSSLFVLFGLLPMLPLVPLLRFIPLFSSLYSYTGLLIIYIFTSSMRLQCSQFARARNLVKLYAVDGILTTFTLLIFNLIFISHLQMGVKGFMISIILSDFLSSVFLCITSNTLSYIKKQAFNAKLGKSMLMFCLPLIPTTIMWTFTGFSDQLFIGAIKGFDDAGIYSAATKIPNLISMVSTVFFQAWNMSAITENESKDRDIFYEKIYGAYEAILFISGAFLILLVKPVSALLINYTSYPEYKSAYIYTPLLILAAVFTCLNLFLASIYTATKNTKNAFTTILVVFISNIILNELFIPMFGMQGAALATFLSYYLCFVIRLVDTRKFIAFKRRPFMNLIGTMLILIMCVLTFFQPENYLIYEAIIFIIITILFIKPLLPLISRFVKD